ncbi:unnamed protein product [Closterium sp. NIES-53]
MASLRVLAFDHEGRPIQFDTWLDDLQLYLLSDSRDSVSLFDHTSGASPAPPATADSATCSHWLTRDAAARLAIRNHLSLAECAHFGQHRTAQALYDAIVARYSWPATAALGRLLLPHLFPKLSAFAIVEDLVYHLCPRGARYHAAIPAEFLDRNQPPMFITLYFIVTRLPDSLRSVRDHFLALDPTVLTVVLLEHHLIAAKTSVVTVGAARGTPCTPFFEGCSPSPLSPSYASATAVDVLGTEDVGAASARGKRRSSKGKGGRGGGGGSCWCNPTVCIRLVVRVRACVCAWNEPRVFGLDKFNGDNFAEWSFKMENIFDHYDLLEVMEGTEKRPENDPEKSPWVRKSAQGYLLLGQALGSSQIRHIKPFQREPEKGLKAWAALNGVHAPATAAVAVVLERQMAALRIEEDKAVEEGVQKFFDLLTRLEGADLNYSELQKKTKLLALLLESWSLLIINLNRDLPRLSLEDVKQAILQEDFRRRELASADGAGAASIGRGGAGGGRGRGRGGRGGRGGGAASMKSAGNESESRDDRFPGQFFFVSTQAPAGPEKDERFEEPAAVEKVTLHSLDYWVIDSGATYSMTPRADLLTELEPSPVKHVTSALGQRAEVKGMGKAMFKGADGKMLGLKNIPVVPMPKERQVAASISTKGEAVGSGDGANGRAKEMKSKKCNLGGTSKIGEHEESGAATLKQHNGEENPKAAAEEEYGENMWDTIASAAFSNPTSATGECDWLTLHRRMGHVALPILQQLVKNEIVAGIRVKGEPDEVLGCPACMQAKFTRFPFSSSEATAKAPIDEVVMDVVGLLKLGAARAEYFLTIVDVYTRMTWVYVLSKKSDVAEMVKTDWLPMVERQQDRLVKAIRTDRGGEFLSKEFGLWLKKNGIRYSLTMPYSSAMNGIAERANRTITETARGLLIEAGLPDYFWPDAVRSAVLERGS